MKRTMTLLLLCALCTGWLGRALGEHLSAWQPQDAAAVSAVTVARTPYYPGPKEAATGGNTLWMLSEDGALYTFTATQPLTDAAFCAVRCDEEADEPITLGRVLWKLPDMAPGDVAKVFCLTEDADLYYDVARIALRWQAADGSAYAAVPYLSYTEEDDAEVRLLPLTPAQGGAPVDRAAVEANIQALYDAYARTQDEETLYDILQQYEAVLESDPWASWAHLGLGKAQMLAAEEPAALWEPSEALGALHAAISLGESDPEAYYLRALAQYSLALSFYPFGTVPGDQGWPQFDAALRDMERALAEKPEDFPYDFETDYIELLCGAGRTGEAQLLTLKQQHRDNPEDADIYQFLVRLLVFEGLLDEAEAAISAWRAQTDPDAQAPAYCAADMAYEAGQYEEAIRLYRALLAPGDEEDDAARGFYALPVRVWYRLADAYAQLARYEEASLIFDELDATNPPVDIPAIFYNQQAEALLAMGDVDDALDVLYEATFLWDDEESKALLKKAQNTLPSLAQEALQGTAWAAYAPVAMTTFTWWEDSLIVAMLQKDAHNVLCLLQTNDEEGTCWLIVTSDRAVYQDDRVPTFYIDDATGWFYLVYEDEDASPSTEAYAFCSRWFWEDELGYPAPGDWVYMFVEAYRTYQPPNTHEYAYFGQTTLTVSHTDEALCLDGCYEPGDGSTEEWEALAEMEVDAARYTLDAFDIAQVNADIEALSALADPERLAFFMCQ